MKLPKERPDFSTSTGFQSDFSSPSTVPKPRLESDFHWEPSQKLEKPLQLSTLAHINLAKL